MTINTYNIFIVINMSKKVLDINPKLNVGDNIILLYMKGESKSPGLKGVVTRINNVFGEDVISVDWEDNSKLSLLSTEDAWALDNSIQIKESDKNKWWSENLEIANFNTKVITDFLIKVRDSGITNMFGASPYLWMGKERLEHEFEYKNVIREDEFQEVLDTADEVQSEMINGCIKILEKENKELSIENINRYLRKYSEKLLMHYINVLS